MKTIYYAIFCITTLLIASCVGIHADALQPLVSPDLLPTTPLHYAPPKAKKTVLPNGMTLYMMADHEIPLVHISAVVRTGAVYDPDGKEGLAEMTGYIMRTGGTDSLSGDAVDDILETFAGILTISVNRDHGIIHLSVLKKNMDEGLKILAQIIQHPAFEDGKLQLAKALKVEELRRINDDPQKLAFREFNRLLYQHHPRGRLSFMASIDKIKRVDLVNFYKDFFYPKNISVTVTGDITENEAIAKMNQYFGAWHVSATSKDKVPIPKKQNGGIYFLLKDIPQSIIIHGNLAPIKSNDDSFAFEILDFIVGSGGFRSRIFHEVRSKQGLAYSAGSFYKGTGDAGVFGAYAICSSDESSTVLEIIQSIIRDIQLNSISKSELEWAKKSITNSFIFSFLSANQIAQQQMMSDYDRLPEDYLITYRDKIKKVSSDEVRTVAERYLSFENAVILVVGSEKVYRSLESKFGKIQRVGGVL